MESQKIIDIHDLKAAFEKLQARFNLLENRLYAVAIDYQHYIDNNFLNNRLYELRDNVIYRLFSSNFHIHLLIRQQSEIRHRCVQMMNDGNWDIIQGMGPVHPIRDQYKKEISSIFDSLLYHIVSTFDFTSSLVNYIYAKKQDKQNNIKWTSLTRIARDVNNLLFPSSISEAILKHDQFVSKLYGYRSNIIHEKGDLNDIAVNATLGSKNSIAIGFVATPKLIKTFSELKKIAGRDVLSSVYVSFWLLNKAIDHITDLLFEIKANVQQIENPPGGILVVIDPITKEHLSVSKAYWFEEDYIKNKK